MSAPSLVLALILAAQSSQPSGAPAPSSQPAIVDDAPGATSQPSPVETPSAAEHGAEGNAPATLRLREDVLPWTAFATGLVLGVSGSLVTFIGAWPVLSILRAQAILADADARDFQEGDQSLIALRTAEIYDRNLTFQRVGAPLLGAGLALLACGALMAAGGLYTGVKLTVDE